MESLPVVLAADALPLLGILAALAAVAGLAIWSHVQARKRREALDAFARSRGLRYSVGRVRVEHRFPFACLRKGSNRYAENLLEGPWGDRTLCGFDYHYETYSSDSKGRRRKHHHWFSAVVLASDVPLRPLVVRPENLLDKLAEFVGFDDIDFESAEFSRRFHVKSPDRRWAYDVLHARTLEFLLARPAVSIEFSERHVIAWKGSRFAVEEFRGAVDTVAGVLDRLPEYLVKQQRGVDAGGIA